MEGHGGPSPRAAGLASIVATRSRGHAAWVLGAAWRWEVIDPQVHPHGRVSGSPGALEQGNEQRRNVGGTLKE
jgi:hypothetical protein